MSRSAGSLERQSPQGALFSDLDRLLHEVERVAGELHKLRVERERLRSDLDRIAKENARLMQIAGVADGNELMTKMARLTEMDRSSQAMGRERAETARRLQALIEKVDLLQQET
jgi:predicted nuclease with TOPRIM domain